jgi:hypothetical protein
LVIEAAVFREDVLGAVFRKLEASSVTQVGSRELMSIRGFRLSETQVHSFFGSAFFSAAFFCASTVHGGTIPFTRA